MVLLTHLGDNLRQCALMAAHNRMHLLLGDQAFCHGPGHLLIPLGISPDDLDGTSVHPSCRIDILRRKVNSPQNIGADGGVVAAQSVNRADPDRLARQSRSPGRLRRGAFYTCLLSCCCACARRQSRLAARACRLSRLAAHACRTFPGCPGPARRSRTARQQKSGQSDGSDCQRLFL